MSTFKLIEPFLYQDERSGRYYFRADTSQGSQRLQMSKSLKTTVKRVAQERLRAHVKSWEARLSGGQALVNGAVSMVDLVRLYSEDVEGNMMMPAWTRHSRRLDLKRMLRSWPDLLKFKPSDVTNLMVRDWAVRVLPTIHRKVPPGSTQPPKPMSPASANKCIDALSVLMQFGVDRRLLAENPVHDIPRQRVMRTKLNLPNPDQFDQVLDAMQFLHRAGPVKAFLALTPEQRQWKQRILAEHIGVSVATLKRYIRLHHEGRLTASGNGADAADLARGLAATGMRIAEANALKWHMIDFDNNMLSVPGTKSQSSIRVVPMSPVTRALFRRMRAERSHEPQDGSVFRVKECLKALKAACDKVGVCRLTHHSLRHLFATTAVKGKVDMPSVAALLGHKDRGVLAMKTYAHVDDEHLRKMATQIAAFTRV